MKVFSVGDGYSLRLATLEDLPRLHELVNEFKITSPYKDVEFSFELIANLFQALTVVVMVHENTIVGFIACSIQSNPFVPEWKMAHEHTWYVQPAHRGKHSWSLVNAYEEWAKMNECTHVTMSHLTSLDLSKQFDRTGYKIYEQVYVKELN